MAGPSLESLSAEAITELAQLSVSLANNPATRKQFLEITKKVSPSASFPELEMDARLDTELKARDGKIASLENKIREDDVRRGIETRRTGLREKGFSAEDVTGVEKLMIERKIPDYDTASEFYRLQQHAATPTPPAPAIGLPKDILKEFAKDPRGKAQELAHQAIDELKRARA